MADAKRDNNYVTTLLAVSNADGITPVVLWGDPTTHRLLTQAATAGYTLLTATGAVNGSNTSFTFTQQPTFIVSDGAWYRINKGWTFAVLTATMSVAPQSDIWGFV